MSAYRSENPQPTHVCIVCFKTTGLRGDSCDKCRCPLSSLDEPGVVAELRRHAKAKKTRAETRQLALALSLSAVFGIIVFVLLDWLGLRAGRDRWTHAGPDESVWLEFWPLATGFALALLPMLWLAGKVFPSPPGAERFKPEQADVSELLRWLGVKWPEKSG